MINYNFKIVLVIILTVFFSSIGVSISNTRLLIAMFAVLTIGFLVLILFSSIQKINKINESVPSFLNFVNLTMSTGKSFSYAFESAISYQNQSIQPYYRRIQHRIFYLKHPDSGFFTKSHKEFYKNIFQISALNVHQREMVDKLKIRSIEMLERKRKERSLKAPINLQTVIFCFLYTLVVLWHLSNSRSHPKIELSSFVLFVLGLVLSVFIGRPKTEI